MRRRPSVFLHVGAMKTGSTFLQQVMMENRAALLDEGVLFPTEDDLWQLQVDAVRDRAGPAVPAISRDVSGAWDRLVRQILEHRSTSVVSMEFMSFLRAPGARSFVEGLQGRDVHVVVTVRDARRVVPGLWQTGARNGGVPAWPDFVDELTQDPPDPQSAVWRRFRRTQGIPRMLDTWTSVLPRGRVHVVTVPPSSDQPLLLWERFASVIGVDAAVVAQPPQRLNAALGYPSAELARRVNLSLGEGWRGSYRDATKRVLATSILSRRRASEVPVAPDRRVAEFGARWNAVVRAAVETAGVESGTTLTGDLDDLPTEPAAGLRPTELSLPSAEELLAAAAFALPRMRRRVARLAPGRSAPPEVAEFLRSVPDGTDFDPRPGWRESADPVETAVAWVASSVRAHAAARRAVGATV